MITRSITQSFLTFLILPTYLTHKRHTHAVDLYRSYLRCPDITLTTGTCFPSLRLSLPAFPSSSLVPFSYHLALRGVLKEARRVCPSLPFKSEILISSISQTCLSLLQRRNWWEKGVTGGEWSWQRVTGVCLCMYQSLCLCEDSSSVRCIQTDLLRESEELVWRGGRLSKGEDR